MKFLMILMMAVGAQDTAENAKYRLDSTRMTVDFQDADLGEVVNYLSEATGLNFMIHSDVGEPSITMKVKDLRLSSILRLMLKPRDLTATWSNGVIQIVTKEQARKTTMKTEMYDVRELTMSLRDFAGPSMELTTGGTLPVAGITITLDEPKQVMEDDVIVDLIRESTGEGTWDEEGAAIELVNGMLIVRQSSKVQAEVRKLILKMRQFR